MKKLVFLVSLTAVVIPLFFGMTSCDSQSSVDSSRRPSGVAVKSAIKKLSPDEKKLYNTTVESWNKAFDHLISQSAYSYGGKESKIQVLRNIKNECIKGRVTGKNDPNNKNYSKEFLILMVHFNYEVEDQVDAAIKKLEGK